MLRSRVIGCGGYLPENTISNADLAKKIDTTDEWIIERSGIHQRHIAADGELTSDLAAAAARSALSDASIPSSEIDLLVLATSTPDNTFPATATKVQKMINMGSGLAFDVQAVCAGFICALSVADNFLQTGQAKTAMVIGSETYSRILDWNDRSTCVLFGDGAGAVLLRAQNNSNLSEDVGILSTCLHSDGDYYDALYVDGGVSTTQTSGYLRMQGKEVFRHAVEKLSTVAEEALCDAGLSIDQVDWLVPHQANRRIMDATARKLGLSDEKLVITVDKHANTSSASIPLALSVATSDGRIQAGDLVVLEAIGGGLVWGAGVVRW
tara:strand:- start:13622 stop:14593 length:972 start_codon:yes stop_codon:yes gene_type:complete